MHDDEVTYRIRHTTSYAYSDVVTLAHNEARLSPRNGPFQVAHHARLVVDPAPAFIAREHDYFGNAVNLFVLQEPHRRFSVTAHSEVSLRAPFLPDPGDTPAWEEVRDQLASSTEQEVFEALEHVFESPYVRWNQAIFEYAAQSFTPRRPLLAAALDLSRRIHADFEYRPGVTSVATACATVFEQQSGVCQDFAHLMIACLRSHGLAARYVSGYLLTRPAAGQPRLVGADASHAWIGVYCPDYDFIDLDPTNDVLVTIEHPTLAWGRDFGDVSPLKGVVLGGGAHRVEVSVEVVPMDDDAA
ncbi:MAG TPA: transglutaminase family protein [Polyangiales bacterium]|nr:transglutaminase family protein [Polyangiales bacterium]